MALEYYKQFTFFWKENTWCLVWLVGWWWRWRWWWYSIVSLVWFDLVVHHMHWLDVGSNTAQNDILCTRFFLMIFTAIKQFDEDVSLQITRWLSSRFEHLIWRWIRLIRTRSVMTRTMRLALVGWGVVDIWTDHQCHVKFRSNQHKMIVNGQQDWKLEFWPEWWPSLVGLCSVWLQSFWIWFDSLFSPIKQKETKQNEKY